MVLANGTCHKLREESKNDSAQLLGLIFLAYLDIGGEYFCIAFSFIMYICLLHFVRVGFPSFMFLFCYLQKH